MPININYPLYTEPKLNANIFGKIEIVQSILDIMELKQKSDTEEKEESLQTLGN